MLLLRGGRCVGAQGARVCGGLSRRGVALPPAVRLLSVGASTLPRQTPLEKPGPDIIWNDKSELDNFLLFYSLKHTSHITMRELFEFGRSPTPNTILVAAQFLHEEIPIRLAHMVRHLKKLPLGLSDVPSVRAVRHLYEESFKDIRSMPKPRTMHQEEKFTAVLRNIKERQRDVQQLVADSLRELCTTSERARHHDFSQFLDAFYSSRIGIRLLMGQHIALHEPREGYVGIIESEMSALSVAQMASEAASEMCMHYYGDAPVVEFEGNTECRFTYIPAHLYYVMFELLKNSMRATCEFHADAADLPPITMVFAEGEDDVCIKISDNGGGVKREGIPQIWNYSYTTAKTNPHSGHASPMAGFGHGLPFSRLYCRYFGGNLEVISMEGYGTDVYVYLGKIRRADESLVR